jgi:hypothetical protein
MGIQFHHDFILPLLQLLRFCVMYIRRNPSSKHPFHDGGKSFPLHGLMAFLITGSLAVQQKHEA